MRDEIINKIPRRFILIITVFLLSFSGSFLQYETQITAQEETVEEVKTWYYVDDSMVISMITSTFEFKGDERHTYKVLIFGDTGEIKRTVNLNNYNSSSIIILSISDEYIAIRDGLGRQIRIFDNSGNQVYETNRSYLYSYANYALIEDDFYMFEFEHKSTSTEYNVVSHNLQSKEITEHLTDIFQYSLFDEILGEHSGSRSNFVRGPYIRDTKLILPLILNVGSGVDNSFEVMTHYLVYFEFDPVSNTMISSISDDIWDCGNDAIGMSSCHLFYDPIANKALSKKYVHNGLEEAYYTLLSYNENKIQFEQIELLEYDGRVDRMHFTFSENGVYVYIGATYDSIFWYLYWDFDTSEIAIIDKLEIQDSVNLDQPDYKGWVDWSSGAYHIFAKTDISVEFVAIFPEKEGGSETKSNVSGSYSLIGILILFPILRIRRKQSGLMDH